MCAAEWLSLPSQKLRSIVSGAVFRDDLALEAVRERYSWYPRDVWLCLLGCLWQRLDQEEHLMGRAGYVDDELGSAIIGSRRVRDVIRIAFCLERQYPRTRSGSARPSAGSLPPRRSRRCCGVPSPQRPGRNAGIADGRPGKAEKFWGRPFLVIRGDRVAAAVFEFIIDERLRATARASPIGNIDLVSDNTDVLEDPSLRAAVQAISLV